MNPVKAQKKSYLFLLPWSLSSLGGVNQVVENLYHQMKLDDKFDPIIMVNSWDDVKIRKENINGIDHYFFRLRSPWDSSRKIYNFIMYFWQFFRTTRSFSEFIKKKNISIINVHYCNLFSLNLSLIKFLGLINARIVLSFHGKDVLNAKKSQGIEKKIWKILMYSANNIITCSNYLRNEILSFDSSCANKIVAIHNGIDTVLLLGNKDSPCVSIEQNTNFILNVATLERVKGQDVLIKAFAKIAQDFEDICLIIIGRPGGAEGHLKSLIESIGLSHRIFLYEGLPHDEVLSFMKRAMIFVLPSRFESFGIVILEAGVFATPVIATDIGGIREILSDNKTGIFFESDNIDSLTIGLRLLLSDDEKRKLLGKNLKKHILDNFSWERTYKNYLDVIGMK